MKGEKTPNTEPLKHVKIEGISCLFGEHLIREKFRSLHACRSFVDF